MPPLSTQQGKRAGSADIAAALRRDIANGVLQVHDPLPAERRLAETWGVSRGTIREALGRLERENLVETRRGSGTYVVENGGAPAGNLFESARPLELIDARFALEPHICRLAVLHGRARDFERLEELLALMERSVEDPSAFAEADADFHARLAEATGNSLLSWIIAQVNLVRSREEWTRMRHLTLERGIIERYNEQHRQIVDAMVAREGDRAASLMKRHLETARLSLTRAMAT
jgi:GntR family uxuAB operon transcriptional repressor